jgi:hypothetical protein
MMPVRKAVLHVLDPSTGKIYPIKVALSGDIALIPIRIEQDGVGIAKEATLSGIKAQTDKLLFDDVGRLYIQNPPNLDVLMSSVRDNMNIGRIGNIPQTGEDWTPHIKNIDNLSTEKTLSYMAVEDSKRCFDVTVDDTFAVPSGQTWYVKSVEITEGKLFLDGDIFIVN